MGSPDIRDDAPLVSISMLTYNAVEFIEEAIESVLDQVTDFAVELVIGDDASADGTQAKLRAYAAAYPRGIRLHLHPVRGGGVPGRVNNMHNLGDCRGRYIAILDGDDYWSSSRKLLEQARFLEANPAYSAVGTDGYSERHPEGTRERFYAGNPHIPGSDVTLATVVATGRLYLWTSSLMMRRAWLLPLPDYFPEIFVADHFMRLELLRKGPAHVLPLRAFVYRVHGANFTATEMHGDGREVRVFDDMGTATVRFPELADSHEYARLRFSHLRRYLRFAIRSASPRDILRGVSRLRHVPWRIITTALGQSIGYWLRHQRSAALA